MKYVNCWCFRGFHNGGLWEDHITCLYPCDIQLLFHDSVCYLVESRHNNTCLCLMRTTRTLISSFVVRCLYSLTYIYSCSRFRTVANFCSCAGRFEYCLVANLGTQVSSLYGQVPYYCMFDMSYHLILVK